MVFFLPFHHTSLCAGLICRHEMQWHQWINCKKCSRRAISLIVWHCVCCLLPLLFSSRYLWGPLAPEAMKPLGGGPWCRWHLCPLRFAHSPSSLCVFMQLATWDSLHGLNGSLKESRIENGMQGVTIKVVTLLVGFITVYTVMEWLQEGAKITKKNKYFCYYHILFVCSYTSDCNSWTHNYYKSMNIYFIDLFFLLTFWRTVNIPL